MLSPEQGAKETGTCCCLPAGLACASPLPCLINFAWCFQTQPGFNPGKERHPALQRHGHFYLRVPAVNKLPWPARCVLPRGHERQEPGTLALSQLEEPPAAQRTRQVKA